MSRTNITTRVTEITDNRSPARVVEEPILKWDPEQCTLCGRCAYICPRDAAVIDPLIRVIYFREERCTGCRQCVAVCPEQALK